MADTQNVKLAGAPEDYERLHMTPDIQMWEDGMHTDGGCGNFEWWYFDSVLAGGGNLVVSFQTKSLTTAQLPLMPQISFEYNAGDKRVSKMVMFKPEEFSASKAKADVVIGKNTFKGDLKHYEIHFEADGVSADILLENTIPSWRPKTGYLCFGEDKYYAWFVGTPEGRVSGTVTIDGETFELSGTGYHDHNWGNCNLPELQHHWYWGRGKIGDYMLINAYNYATKEYGYYNFPVFMLAKDNKILADDTQYMTFHEEEQLIDEVTGKPYHKRLVYDYNDGKQHYNLTYVVDQVIVRTKLTDELPEAAREAAVKAGVDSAYLRFAGTGTLTRYEGDQIVEQVESPALWEEMYFGKSLFNYEYRND